MSEKDESTCLKAITLSIIILTNSFIIFPTAANGQSTNNLIITVYDEGGFPPSSENGFNFLSDVRIFIYDSVNNLVDAKYTNTIGIASFGVSDGTYTIVAEGKMIHEGLGYSRTSKSVTVKSSPTYLSLHMPRIIYHSHINGHTYELNYVDLNTDTPDYESYLEVDPGKTINARFSWRELSTVNVPVWYVSVFGSWRPSEALGNLASGTASPNRNIVHTYELSFSAPQVPGIYKVRLVGVEDYNWPNSFYTWAHYNLDLGRDMGISIISKDYSGPHSEVIIKVRSNWDQAFDDIKDAVVIIDDIKNAWELAEYIIETNVLPFIPITMADIQTVALAGTIIVLGTITITSVPILLGVVKLAGLCECYLVDKDGNYYQLERIQDKTDTLADIFMYLGDLELGDYELIMICEEVPQLGATAEYFTLEIDRARLIAYWSFDEGSGNSVKDNSLNGNDGIFVSNPAWVTGIKGKAIQFDGVDDYIRVETTPSLLISKEITVMGWVKVFSSTNDHQIICAKWYGPSGEGDLYRKSYLLEILPDGRTPQFKIRDDKGVENWAISTQKMNYGEWYHLCGTYDGDEIKIYVNGDIIKVVEHHGRINLGESPVTIGGLTMAIDSNNINGIIDEVKIFNYELSSNEISAEYENRPPDIPTREYDCELFLEIDYIEGFEPSELSLKYIQKYYRTQGIDILYKIDDKILFQESYRNGISKSEFWKIESQWNDEWKINDKAHVLLNKPLSKFYTKEKWILYGNWWQDYGNMPSGFTWNDINPFNIDKAGNYIFISDGANDDFIEKEHDLGHYWDEITVEDFEISAVMHELGHSIGILKFKWKFTFFAIEVEEIYDSDISSVMHGFEPENCISPQHYSTEYWDLKNIEYYTK